MVEQTSRSTYPVCMIAEKRLPSLRRWSSVLCHIFGYARLADIDAKLEQFAVNPRSTPERVGKADCADQLPDVRRQLRTATNRLRLPSPIQPKTSPVPPDYSFWFNDRQCAERFRGHAIQCGKYQPIKVAECGPLR